MAQRREIFSWAAESGKKRKEGHAEYYEAREQKREQFLGLFAQIDDIQEQYGREGLDLVYDFISGRINRDELFKRATVDNLVDYQQLAKDVFNNLKENGVIAEFHGSGAVVLDTHRLKELGSIRVPQLQALRRTQGHVNKIELIYHTLKDREGVSSEDFQKGDYEPKELLYIPEDEQTAFDPEKIKQSRFVTPLWEVSGQVQHREQLKYPTKNGEELNFEAVELATKLYHPQYGDGYRDEEGTLWVRDPRYNREYRPVNRDLIVKGLKFFGSGQEKGGSFQENAFRYLQNKTPELLTHGILQETDFRIATGLQESGVRLERSKLSPNGTLSINHVYHYLGREFYRNKSKVVEIAPGMGGGFATTR